MKGMDAESAAQRYLEADKWAVTRAPRWRHRVRRRGRVLWVTLGADFFGAIDLIALHPTLGFRFVQVCTSNGRSAHRRKVESVSWPLFTPRPNDPMPGGGFAFGYSIELWETREDGFRVHLYDPFARLWDVSPGRIPYG